jgi:hypothetical protein
LKATWSLLKIKEITYGEIIKNKVRCGKSLLVEKLGDSEITQRL